LRTLLSPASALDVFSSNVIVNSTWLVGASSLGNEREETVAGTHASVESGYQTCVPFAYADAMVGKWSVGKDSVLMEGNLSGT